MDRLKIKFLLSGAPTNTPVLIKGWIRTRRDSKTFSFLEVNDGSCLKNMQVIADSGIPGYEDVAALGTGAAVEISGMLVASEGTGQSVEIRADAVKVLGQAPEGHLVLFEAQSCHDFLIQRLFRALFSQG